MKPEAYRKRLLSHSISKLKKIADEEVSEYIRRKYADWKGNVRCFTCHKEMPWKEAQCCHYISRTYLNTRWYERNLRPGCYRCNVLLKGNLDEFAINLEREQPGTLEHLNQWKRMPSTESTRMQLIDLIFTYKQKIAELSTEKLDR